MSDVAGRGPHFGLRTQLFEEQVREFLKIQDGNVPGPLAAEAHARLGQSLLLRGHRVEAMEQATQALELDPGEPLAHHVLSLALMRPSWPRTRQWDAAIVHAEAAIQSEPSNSVYRFQLGLLYLNHPRAAAGRKRQMAAKALEVAEAGLAIHPDCSYCQQIRAQALATLNRRVEAEQAFLGALRESPDDAYLLVLFGRFLIESGRLQEAERVLDKAVRLQPGSRYFRFHRNLARLAGECLAGGARLALLLGLVRPRPQLAQRGGPAVAEELIPNWPIGMVLAVTVLALTRVFLDLVGDREPLLFCIPASMLAISACAIFGRYGRRLGDHGRLTTGAVMGSRRSCGSGARS